MGAPLRFYLYTLPEVNTYAPASQSIRLLYLCRTCRIAHQLGSGDCRSHPILLKQYSWAVFSLSHDRDACSRYEHGAVSCLEKVYSSAFGSLLWRKSLSCCLASQLLLGSVHA